MKGKRFLKRLAAAFRREDYQASYSQCGEDVILKFVFSLLKISHPTYLDIGAHHPTHLSNSYLFYKDGSRGVCIEPDPVLFQRIQQGRPGDTCLNVGIGIGGRESLDFYVFDDPTMNTFSLQIKQEQEAAGRKVEKVLKVEVVPVNEIIRSSFAKCPNFVSLDTEGLDLAILQTFDFGEHRPEVFCIETLTNTDERKMDEIINFMLDHGYFVYADTYVNSIFVDKKLWQQRLDDLYGKDAI